MNMNMQNGGHFVSASMIMHQRYALAALVATVLSLCEVQLIPPRFCQIVSTQASGHLDS